MSNRKLVIVVDDDPSVLRAVQRVLQVHGFEVQAFNTVEDFLEGGRLNDATCLVLDIHLDGSSGIEVRRQLTRSGHSLPVIFITAVESEVTHKAALEAGCVAYLNKPFPSGLLIEAVETTMKSADANVRLGDASTGKAARGGHVEHGDAGVALHRGLAPVSNERAIGQKPSSPTNRPRSPWASTPMTSSFAATVGSGRRPVRVYLSFPNIPAVSVAWTPALASFILF